MGTYESAVNLRTRLHYFRKLDRQANAEVYETGHPMHGQTVYDEYVVRIVPDEDAQYWIYIQPRSSRILAIEGLSEVGDMVDAPALEDHSRTIDAIDESKPRDLVIESISSGATFRRI